MNNDNMMPDNDSLNNESKKGRFKFPINPILLFGVVILFMLTGIFIKVVDGGYGGGGIKIYVPFGFIPIFISFYLFREYNRVWKAKREERREYLNQRRKEILDRAIKSKMKKDDNGNT